ncbi:Branched-chain-amino-acid transaminase 1 [Capnocytophaga canimorsus]|uniref:Branched-chain-amino-acid aminotransferase n=1 Tax=Capnocytophaga canimorsus TaxID=28188 RepID=A0A0B7HHU9_9FLAO|nr:branched-chain amino acid aminotransferase [Capnocytophaga canimorsus]ATA77073.1 branched chain amino acid aminotransferase [Capnocytophaga canimorsus]PJI83787.1 branched-chain amino acid aminotransferase [Capnocytophaga canimorsus]CEN37492.1 Branched-chain-amino-acid transaminase 1 [Capnocytophaga canimorsus]STA72287.1 Branched-chain-amino-acid transaminase 1 [Capnocytophaga canimorsus]
MNLEIERVKQSRIGQVDFSNLAFGKIFSDHMFFCHYKDGQWQQPQIKPYAPITLEPSASVFHYGQAVFEGMKAYKDDAGDIFLFRPFENYRRLNKSSKRLAIPEFPEEWFDQGLRQLLKIDSDWIQKGFGNSLYIRPFVIAMAPGVMASPSKEYMFFIITSPVQSYYGGDVKVKIADYYSRAANGGFGAAKAAGNYAGQFYPTQLAIQEGYQQIIWTDDTSHEYLEEAGTMNLFFRIDDTLITCPTSDRILDGVTRKSVITMAEKLGIKVEVRPVKVQELVQAAEKGTLQEIFGSGTAAVISPISGFGYNGKDYTFTRPEKTYAQTIKDAILNIQYNKTDDPFGWRIKI